MELPEKMKVLNSKWRTERPQYNNFVSDGILNYHEYKKQKFKILFLLKESHSGFIDISPFSEGYGPNGASKTFWRYMRGYEYIINSTLNNQPYDGKVISEIKEEKNINTAYVNIKKQCDNNTKSDDAEIQSYAINDRELLKEQIDLINPDVIYCAGTFDSYKILNKEIKELSPRIYQTKKRIIIDFYHLAHRKGYKTFKELYDLMSNVDII